jgi:hypothetical protein
MIRSGMPALIAVLVGAGLGFVIALAQSAPRRGASDNGVVYFLVRNEAAENSE